jgi:hypothetical protein
MERTFVKRLRRRAAVALVAAFGLVSVGAAQAGSMRFAQNWDDLSPDQRNRALENYQRYKKLPPDRRRSLDKSYERWRGMDPNSRERVRRNYESYRQLDKQQRKDFGKRYQQWRQDGGDR